MLAYKAVADITLQIEAAAQFAVKLACVHAYKTVYLSTLGLEAVRM
jgi:hypothetical protein